MGDRPNSVAIGDVNADGKADLITANQNGNSVSVLLSTGSGSFGAPTNFGVDNFPYSVAVADVNDDGKADIVTANAFSNNVSVLLGTGTGSFGTATNFDVGNNPRSVAVRDLNGDGKPDIITANNGSNNVSVLLGTGGGSFGAATNFAVGTSPVAVAVADVNNDGKADIVTANIGISNVSVLLGTGTGSFGATTTFAVGTIPVSLAVADVNNDGKPDIITANNGSNNVSVLLGTGTGSFGTVTNLSAGTNPYQVATGDVNLDGKTDLITVSYASNAVSVLLGTGGGSFGAATSFAVGIQPQSVAIGDLNGDGKPDIVAGNAVSNNVSVLLNQQVVSYDACFNQTTFPVGSNPSTVVLGDVNSDGNPDIITANLSSNNVSVLLGDGTGSLGAAINFPAGNFPRSVAVADVNGDGKADIITANEVGNTVSVLLGAGTGVFGTPTNFAVVSRPYSVAVRDINADGKPDIITANNNSASVSVLLGDGTGSFGAATNFAVGSNARGVAVGDVNGDGKPDIISANTLSNNVSVLLGDGTGSFGAATNFAVGTVPVSVAVGDVNADGKPDIISANQNSNSVSVLLGTGTGSFGAPTNFVTGITPVVVVLGDVNSDGNPDIISANFSSSNVSVLLGTGTGSFGPATSFAGGDGVYSVAVGDINGDGKPDFVTANQSGDNVSVLLQGQAIGITSQPVAGSAVCAGGSVTASVSANGIATGYQWYKDGGVVSGQTSATLTLSNVTSASAGSYSVVVTSACNNLISTAFSLTVNPPPTLSIGANPSLTITTGQSTTLTASGADTYLWSSGQTTASITATPTSTTAYSVTGTSAGCSSSTSVTVTVNAAPAPTITALSPARNARTAPATTNVAITFSTPISSGAATLGSMRVFSQQRGGQLRNGQGGSASASGNTLTFNPTTNFRPGETILTTVTSSAQSSGGVNLARGQVHQFTVGVGGTGRGNFTPPATNPNPAVGDQPSNVALGDVDGDGDLDFLVANYSDNNVSVRLNNGTGDFTPPPTNPNPAVGSQPISVAVGDLDGDGDLDLLAANYISRSVSVRLNDGAGNFTSSPTNPNTAVGGQPYSMALGDVDGDGDLDFVTVNYSNSGSVSIRLNDGAGNFTPPPTNPNPAVGSFPQSVALGDVDGDGDLDLLTANSGSNSVSVRLNDGTGNFTPPATNPNPAVGSTPQSVALGDVDGDDDLDLITANYNSTVSVRLNDGAGNFTPPLTNPNPAVEGNPFSVAVGDVDGDGDLDLLTANYTANSVSVRLNDGAGSFTPPPTNPNPAVGSYSQNVVLGDVDGDGDLDFLAVNQGSVSVRLNQSDAPSLTGFVAVDNTVCEGSPLSFTATVGNVSGSYSYTLTNGSSTTSGTAASPAFSQSLTAIGTGPQPFTLTVSSGGQLATATTPVTVNALPVAGLINDGPLTCSQPSVTLTASGGSSYIFTSPAGQVLAGTGNTRTVSSPGTYSVVVANEAGCVSSTSTTVSSETAAASVSINPSSATLSCASPSVSLTAVGTGSVRWNNGSTESIITVSTAGTYSVTLTSGSGCTATASTVVSSETAAASVSINPSSATLSCASPSVSLTAVGMGSVLWNTGSTKPIITVSTGGTYSVTLTSGSGCTATASTVVSSETAAASVSITPSSATLTCTSPSVSLTAVGSGSVLWNTGSTEPIITVSTGGTYSVTLTNGSGCTATASTVVSSETAAASVSINPSSTTLTCATSSVSLTAVGSGSVLWNTGSTERVITVSTGGTYSVTLTNGSGCTATASTSVSQGPDQTIAFIQQPLSATSVTVGTNVSASVLVSGPATGFQWYKDNLSSPVTGQTGPSLSLPNVQLSDAGSYSVVVTGACNSLTSTAFSLSVTPVESAPFAITGVSTLSCTPVQPNRFSVSFSPRYSGLTGQPVSFGIVNELLPTPEPGPYTIQLYSDNPLITLTASQSGTPDEARFSYDWLAACRASESGNTPPRVVSGVPPQSATVGVGFSYVIPQGTFTDDQTPGSLLLSAAGLPPGISLAGYTLSGVPSTTVGSPFSVTLTATDPGGLSVSTSVDFSVAPAPQSPPDPTQPFAITGVSMLTCTPVADRININFSPRYGGLNGQAIAFRVENELAPTNEPGPYSLTLYRDNPVITLRATQTGSVGEASFVYNWLAACAGQGQDNTAPVVVNPLGSQTAVVGASYVVSLANVFVDQETPGSLSLTVSGLPVGLSLVGQSIQGVASVSGVSTVSLVASDPGGLSAATSFVLTVSSASSTTVSPPVGFGITGVQTVSCEVVSGGERRLTFQPQYSGLSGAPIRFGVDNELAPTTNAGPYSLNLYTDNPVITLRAEQGGVEATYRYDWLSVCSPSGRLGGGEPRSAETLRVVVLGNPVSGDRVEVAVRGAAGDRLLVRVVDERGHAVSETIRDRAASEERMNVKLGRSAGVYLLQVSTPSQRQTVKVLRH